jgi:hypothetical protein
MYVDRLQFTTVLLPLLSAGYYPDGNSQGNTMENSGKQNPKMGFKSPPSRGENRLYSSFCDFLIDFGAKNRFFPVFMPV